MTGGPVSPRGGGESRSAAEADVVAGLIGQEAWALRTLTESFGKYVYGQALRILRSPHLAEEVAQDALLVMWWNPERFDPSKGSLKSFVMGVARFKAIDVVRREQKRRSKESLLVESAAFFETAPADRGVTEGMALRRALLKLSEPQREAIFFAYYGGLTYRQVAEVLDVPEGTVKARLRDGLTKLRAVLPAPTTG